MTQTGIVISNREAVVKEFEDVSLETMYKEIGCHTVDVVSLDHNIDLWVDDNGLLVRDNVIHRLNIEGQDPEFAPHLAGNIFILANDGEGGTIGLSKEQVEWVKQNITFIAYFRVNNQKP